MEPRYLSLVNSYNLGELKVNDILVVVTVDGNESLWIASSLLCGDVEEDVLSVYAIFDSESGPAFKMDVGYVLVISQYEWVYLSYYPSQRQSRG